MKNMHAFLVAALASWASLAEAQIRFSGEPNPTSRPAPVEATDAEREAAVKLLARDLAPLLKKPSRTFRTFHYNPRASTGMDEVSELHSAKGMDYVRSKSERFWKVYGTGTSYSNVGDGLYLAADPVQTLSYAEGADFSLVEVDISPRTTLLDISKQLKLAPDTFEALEKTGCFSRNFLSGSGSGSEVLFEGMQHDRACQKVLNPALRAMGVSVLAYNYGAAKIKGCQSKQVAFVLINPEGVQAEQVSVFQPSMNLSDPAALAEAKILYKVIRENASQSSGMYSSKSAVMTGFEKWAKTSPEVSKYDMDPSNQAEVDAWKKKHLPFCEPKSLWTTRVLTSLHLKKQKSPALEPESPMIMYEHKPTTDLGFRDLKDAREIRKALGATEGILKQVKSLTGVATIACPSPRVLQILAAKVENKDVTSKLKYCEGLTTCIYNMKSLGSVPKVPVLAPEVADLFPPEEPYPLHVMWRCTPDASLREADFRYNSKKSILLRCD